MNSFNAKLASYLVVRLQSLSAIKFKLIVKALTGLVVISKIYPTVGIYHAF